MCSQPNRQEGEINFWDHLRRRFLRTGNRHGQTTIEKSSTRNVIPSSSKNTAACGHFPPQDDACQINKDSMILPDTNAAASACRHPFLTTKDTKFCTTIAQNLFFKIFLWTMDRTRMVVDGLNGQNVLNGQWTMDRDYVAPSGLIPTSPI